MRGKDPARAALYRATTAERQMPETLGLRRGRRQWKSEKHAAQWRMILKVYVKPLRHLPVNEIGIEHVLACLKPQWERRPETAQRLPGRIERVLNAAKAAGHRDGENPAAWRGHLENLLPAQTKLSRGHHPALPFAEIPDFISKLRQRDGVAPLALVFLILTAARSGEVRCAKWEEFDLSSKIWTIPAARMKGGRTHRVPLTDCALEILEVIRPVRRDDDLVFPGIKRGAPLSDMTLASALRCMKIPDVTPRSSPIQAHFGTTQ